MEFKPSSFPALDSSLQHFLPHYLHRKEKNFPPKLPFAFQFVTNSKLALQSRTVVLIPFFNVLCYRSKDLSPLLGAILHLNGCDAAEKLL